MVIKVKEITVGRGRKWAWDYGNSVDYYVSITIEGTTAKDTVEDMIKTAISEIVPMESSEQDRCRNIYDIAEVQAGMEFKETLDKVVEKTAKEPAVRRSSPGFKSYKEDPQFKEEKIEVSEEKTIITEAVLMDPNEVTIMAKTDLSLLVTKKGFQKWIPFSLMPDISKDDYNKGEYIEKIVIKEDKRKWFNEVKGWDKLEVRKS